MSRRVMEWTGLAREEAKTSGDGQSRENRRPAVKGVKPMVPR